jgi:adenylylsulfate kinase
MIEKNIVWHEQNIKKEDRVLLKKQKPVVLWFTGLSGSGKSTIANALEVKLYALEKHSYLLDGDNIRMGLNKGLTFSEFDRVENIRRIGEVSKLFIDAGLIVLTAFISPFRKERDSIRELLDKEEFIEIFVDTPLSLCEIRDPKGLYRKARSGEISNFTGIASPYEAPINAEIILQPKDKTVDECVNEILNYLKLKGYLKC